MMSAVHPGTALPETHLSGGHCDLLVEGEVSLRDPIRQLPMREVESESWPIRLALADA